MIQLILLLAAAVLLYMCLSHWARRDRTALSLKNEVIVSADDSTQGMSMLRSKRYGLVGRPDQLIRVGRMLIPVEQKPTARRMQQLHVLQLAAQCLLCRKSMVFAHRTGYWCLRAGRRSAWRSRRRSRPGCFTRWRRCVRCCAQTPSPGRAGLRRSADRAATVRPAGVLSIEAALYATMN